LEAELFVQDLEASAFNSHLFCDADELTLAQLDLLYSDPFYDYEEVPCFNKSYYQAFLIQNTVQFGGTIPFFMLFDLLHDDRYQTYYLLPYMAN